MRNPGTVPRGRIAVLMFVSSVLVFLSASPLRAQSPENSPQEVIEDESVPEESWEHILIQRNIAIANFFDGLADGLDLFLVGERLTRRKNDSSVRLDHSTYLKDGTGMQNVFGVGVNLRLPNLEKYWSLKFTSYDEQEEKRNVRANYFRQTPRENNPGATLGLFQKLGDIRTSFEPRVELQDPLKISHSLTFESVAAYQSFEINPELELYASSAKGSGAFVGLNFLFQLTKRYTMTLINEGDYRDKLHEFSVSNGVSFGHIYSSKTSFSYDFIMGSNNRPSYHLESYTVGATMNHLIYRRILNYSVSPYLDFQKTQGFRAKAGLTFNISLTF